MNVILVTVFGIGLGIALFHLEELAGSVLFRWLSVVGVALLILLAL